MAWTNSDDFIAFSFGDFDSKDYGIYRTSNSDRYNIELAPQMTDIVVDIPGGDGQYYFGTYHKAKVFNIDFAFDHLSELGLAALKKAFDGKELKELCFSETSDRVWMAKVTGTPALKVMPFDEATATIYKGEGSIQLTAYWPHARGKTPITRTSNTGTSRSISFNNTGELPAFLKMTSDVAISQLRLSAGVTISGTGIKYWDSKTGIIKNGTSSTA